MAGAYSENRRVFPGELLDQEFLEMPIAAAVAYYKITETRVRLPEGSLSEMVHLTAIALSTVAPIYMASDDGGGVSVLSADEVEKLLFQTLKSGEHPDLDHLRVRKADLERGIETLRASKNVIW